MEERLSDLIGKELHTREGVRLGHKSEAKRS